MTWERDLEASRRLLEQINELAHRADANQWNPAPKLITERVGKPTPGKISDPTGELATDMNRLDLRSALQSVERDARLLREGLERMHFSLQKAVKPYAE